MSMAYTAFRRSEEDSLTPEPSEDEVYESVVQAVLAHLGITLGEWEWRISWAAGWAWKATRNEVAARELVEVEGGTVQRRRKVSTDWQDAE